MANTFSGDEIDKMKADAIRRARQMHSRAAIPSIQPDPPPIKEEKEEEAPPRKESSGTAPRHKSGLDSLLGMIRMFGMENDQLIIIALILLLYGEKENLPVILALLYIAM